MVILLHLLCKLPHAVRSALWVGGIVQGIWGAIGQFGDLGSRIHPNRQHFIEGFGQIERIHVGALGDASLKRLVHRQLLYDGPEPLRFACFGFDQAPGHRPTFASSDAVPLGIFLRAGNLRSETAEQTRLKLADRLEALGPFTNMREVFVNMLDELRSDFGSVVRRSLLVEQLQQATVGLAGIMRDGDLRQRNLLLHLLARPFSRFSWI